MAKEKTRTPLVKIDHDKILELSKDRKENYIPDELRGMIRYTTAELMMAAYNDREVTKILRETFDLDYLTARRYVKRIRAEIRNSVESLAEDKKLNTSFAVLRLQNLYRLCLEAGQYRTASETLKQLHAMQGLTSESSGPQFNLNIGNTHVSSGNIEEVPDDVLHAEFVKKQPQRIDAKPIPREMTLEQAEEVIDDWDD